MASVTPPHSTISVKSPEPDYKGSTGTGDVKNHVVVDVALRVMLFATSLIGIIVMVTSKQTKLIPVAPGMALPMAAEFNQSPAFIYYVVALSVACLYSIISSVLSVLVLLKPKGSSTRLLFHFLILDAFLLGIMASATGAAGAVAYLGYKGNAHTRWNEVCNMYDSFCSHIAGSVTISLLPSIALLLLIWLSVLVLSKKIMR
ncbi:putative casparian strip membrane protein [Helianthus annuus]|uniref:CASP-like protein n=1 Tax=Helianthus annuus TaxID=4232 RepID=A0A251VA55_HELAN|nr:CASP-like protein 1 [Helianthus annuus]KAF5815363.1 putative casparian strip membrane protein [Helianthus annuus]KAJ0601876.1 putative casparian strip membrane protein [Helianthus annuus]KAJ0936714.1 putative casparian strip membrane protein [Helianthus annuus]KAJ0944628.1 putative casparian strip membrane protein [Helianthus annuus]